MNKQDLSMACNAGLSCTNQSYLQNDKNYMIISIGANIQVQHFFMIKKQKINFQQDWRCSSNSRALDLQVQSPEFKSWSPKKRKFLTNIGGSLFSIVSYNMKGHRTSK
jgi:hypothetical protein